MKYLAFVLFFIAGTSMACPRPTLVEAAIFDTSTTVVGLSNFANATELNPAGFIGSTILRALIVANEDKLDQETKVTGSAMWTGAGVHNLVHLLGAGFVPSLAVGIITGLWIKFNNDCKKGKENG